MNVRRTTTIGSLCLILAANPTLAAKKTYGGNGRTGNNPPPARQPQNTMPQQPTPQPAKPRTTENTAATQATSDMHLAETAVRDKFEQSASFKAAQTAVTQAQSAYDAATEAPLDVVHKTPDYTAAQAKLDADEKVLHDAQAANDGSSLATDATTVMNDHTVIKKLEEAALADPTVVDAHAKLNTAIANLAAIKAKEKEAVEADPAWQSAKARLDASRPAKPDGAKT